MSSTTSRLRVLTAVALFASTILVAGCGSSDKVSKTTTTEQTTAPVTSSSTTTTTRQTQ